MSGDYKEHKLIRFFAYAHLPEGLQKISKPFHSLAKGMDALLPDCEEKDVAMRKLLEAKDCAVRANIPEPKK
ncbi:hypothetical protein [Methylovulum psychrotolerans]|uniref:Uncharacterized protein n=1 Tax=Methylovulum psychrotolerans TaxID=1704499 RepID=A0A1Z4C0E8_9GAMM|nr:hypothetical protein [Methylovulum psychrotolerans]ASF47006.1 hypothetical protein CEK71_13510 [Methylovulum psychrotolerans]